MLLLASRAHARARARATLQLLPHTRVFSLRHHPHAMPDPKLQAYLAHHYLSGPKADAILAREGVDGKQRKKKRKTSHRHGEGDGGGKGTSSSSSSSSGLRLRDDADDWKRRQDDEDDNNEAGPSTQVVKAQAKERFRKGAFKGVDDEGQGVDEPERGEDAPQVASVTQGTVPSVPSQPRSGLRTKEQVRAERIEREEAERLERERNAASAQGGDDADSEAALLAQTTVHRDASGRRIDVEAEDEALRREEARRRRKEAEKREANRGETQRRADRAAREELERVQSEGVARYASDRRMNEELRAVQRAEDPAMAFLTKKRDAAPSMPKYKGPPPPPNRFGIAPGYRWDGVVRGNGFEKKLFEARGAKMRREQDARTFGESDL